MDSLFSFIIPNVIIMGAVLAFYLNSRKTGFKVVTRYTVGSTPLGCRLKSIVLENKKDKPIIIDPSFRTYFFK